jgi:tetratricopeptide (TPR) repeat protein
MPSKRHSRKPDDLSELARHVNEVYGRLLSFLDLSFGFALAVAVCDDPELKDELILRAVSDAKKFGVAVQRVDISKAYIRDFALAVRSHLDARDGVNRIAVMVTGIDSLVYRPDADHLQESDSRPPFVARLNFDRERISEELPFPLVLWLEKEAFTLLLREAPDLTQWMSAHFDFGGVPPVGLTFFRTLLLATDLLPFGDIADTSFSSEDSLIRELEKIPKDGDPDQMAKRAIVLSLLSQKHAFSSKWSEARKYEREFLKLSRQLNDKRLEGKAHHSLGIEMLATGRPKQAIHEFELALQFAEETQNKRLACEVLLDLGKAHAKISSPLALSYLEKSRQAAAGLGDKAIAFQALARLADVYSSTGETVKALNSLEEALSIAKELRGLRQEAAILMRIGLLTREPSKAIVYYERCLAIATRLADRLLEAQCLGLIGATYVNLREFRRAISYLERSLTIARQVEARLIELVALRGIATAYFRLGDNERARDYWNQSVRRAREAKDSLSEAESLLGLSRTLNALREKEKAIKSARRALKIFQESKKSSEVKEAQDLLNQLRETDGAPMAPITASKP